MTRSTSRHLHALPTALALVGAASCWPVAAFAQTDPAPTTATTQPAPATADNEIRLTDAQRADIIENNTADKAAAARGELTEAERIARGIHGEVGVMIGSNGTRGIYGTADIPLGDNAGATVSFESSQYGYRYRR
jgi:hypothetical protein